VIKNIMSTCHDFDSQLYTISNGHFFGLSTKKEKKSM